MRLKTHEKLNPMYDAGKNFTIKYYSKYDPWTDC